MRRWCMCGICVSCEWYQCTFSICSCVCFTVLTVSEAHMQLWRLCEDFMCGCDLTIILSQEVYCTWWSDTVQWLTCAVAHVRNIWVRWVIAAHMRRRRMCVVYCIDSGRSAYAPMVHMRRLHVWLWFNYHFGLGSLLYMCVRYCTITHMRHGTCAGYLCLVSARSARAWMAHVRWWDVTGVLYRLFVVIVVYLQCGMVGRGSVWYIKVPVPRPNHNPIRLDPLKCLLAPQQRLIFLASETLADNRNGHVPTYFKPSEHNSSSC